MGVNIGLDGQDLAACMYGACRMPFRGPGVSLDGPYTAVLGGSEVYGKYVAEPFVVLLARRTGRRVVNLGVMNGGVDVFAGDEALLAVAAGAEAVVIQALGALNLSNRFYTVHPRRNDRFLRQSAALAALYPEVDFSDFAFTGHMAVTLRALCATRFEEVADELRAAWVARMRQVTAALPGRRIVLDIRMAQGRGLGPEPFLVTGDMLGRLRESVDEVVTCDVTPLMTPVGQCGRVFAPAERDAALRLPPPAAHEVIAAALAGALGRRDGIAA